MLDPHQRSLRVGLAALACALVFRLFSLGLPEKLVAWLAQPDTAAFLFYLETGRNVRFSTSEAVFSPDFLESPPAQTPIPTFFGEEEVDLTYSTVKDPDIAALLEKPLTWDLYGTEPTVLIVHTHTTESYTKSGETYEETSSWRTLDENYNMLSIGDRVAQVLEGAVRAGDKVYRLGGDEFGLLCGGVGGEDEARRLAKRLLRSLNQAGEGQIVWTSVSIGGTAVRRKAKLSPGR